MTEFTYRVDRRADGTVVALCGEAHNGSADRVREALADLHAERSGPVVIDLHDLHFMASAAIAELIAFRSQCSQHGRPLRLAAATPDIAGMLVSTHLADLFPMYKTADEALTQAD